MKEIKINYWERRRLLYQQMKKMAEESSKCIPGKECDYVHSLVEIDAQLSKPHPIFIAILNSIIAYALFSVLIKLKQFFR